MIILSDYERLTNLIAEKYIVTFNGKQDIGLLLIGGYSRSGKTFLSRHLSNTLSERGIFNIILSLDAWIVSLEKRKQGWTVMDRYERSKIAESVSELLLGHKIFPPVYHPPSRKRVSERSEAPIEIKRGIVIAEGVVALSLNGLLDRALLKIFVDLPESDRILRLKKYYIEEKMMNEEEAKNIAIERELDEIPLVCQTSDCADIVYSHQPFGG